MLKYVLFDVDGTISDTSEGILNGLMYALPRIGLPVPADKQELRYLIGPPLVRAFQKIYGVSEEVAQEGLRQYRSYYGPIGTSECVAYPGIPALLSELRERGLSRANAMAHVRVFSAAFGGPIKRNKAWFFFLRK